MHQAGTLLSIVWGEYHHRKLTGLAPMHTVRLWMLEQDMRQHAISIVWPSFSEQLAWNRYGESLSFEMPEASPLPGLPNEIGGFQAR